MSQLDAGNFEGICVANTGSYPNVDRHAGAQRQTRGPPAKVERRGALDIAKRVLKNCGQIMRYAVANSFAKHNPVAEIKPAVILKSHKRRNYAGVGAKELHALLRAIDGYVGSEHTRLALQLMAMTFARTSELIGARWSEFDPKASRWDIPASA